MKMELIELAKRSLEHSIFSINIDKKNKDEIYSIVGLINEYIPSLILDVYLHDSEKGSIEFICENEIFAFIGAEEPEDLGILWIDKISYRDWKFYKNTIVLLSESGYPGCKNCLGPKYEYLWDEERYRREKNN